MTYIICHYGEIGTKGKNRKFFEQKLVQNLKQSVEPLDWRLIKRISGRIIIGLTSQGEKNEKEIEQALKNVFGLVYFAFAEQVEPDVKSIQTKALLMIKKKKFKTFRVLTQRSKKDFFLTSPEINEKVGGWLKKELNKKVDLSSPDLTVFIEIVDFPAFLKKIMKGAFLYLEKISGPGGLPVGVSGKALCLISGGIDSPVAALSMIKRGLKVAFVHFHAYPYTDQASIEKVEKIVKLLNKYQFQSELYLAPFAEIQKQIYLKTPPKLRVVLYRRMMLRIAEQIGQKQKIPALITGENLGQVASQTLENISVIDRVALVPVFRPLIADDKQEIIEKAKKIGTYEISILPDQDCCSRFLPEHPETKACLAEVEEAEKGLEIDNLVRIALENTQEKKI